MRWGVVKRAMGITDCTIRTKMARGSTNPEFDLQAMHEGEGSLLKHNQELQMMAGRSTRQVSAWRVQLSNSGPYMAYLQKMANVMKKRKLDQRITRNV